MAVELILHAHYADDPDQLFCRAIDFADLINATRKYSTYAGLPPEIMIEGKTYTTDISVLGVFNCLGHQITAQKICPQSRVMNTIETNAVVRSWRHSIKIRPTQNGSIWIERVLIDAGRRTPLVSGYARFMYASRHNYRQATSLKSRLKRAA